MKNINNCYHYIKNKKYSKIILIGDLNLNKVSWPEGVTTCSLQNEFLDTFLDINLTN